MDLLNRIIIFAFKDSHGDCCRNLSQRLATAIRPEEIIGANMGSCVTPNLVIVPLLLTLTDGDSTSESPQLSNPSLTLFTWRYNGLDLGSCTFKVRIQLWTTHTISHHHLMPLFLGQENIDKIQQSSCFLKRILMVLVRLRAVPAPLVFWAFSNIWNSNKVWWAESITKWLLQEGEPTTKWLLQLTSNHTMKILVLWY